MFRKVILVLIFMLVASPVLATIPRGSGNSSSGGGSTINLGTSTSATNPARVGDVTTGLYSSGAGRLDFSSLGNFAGEINSNGAYGLFGTPDVVSSTYHVFGDSIVAGSLASTTANRFVNLLATDMGAVLTNDGVSGAQMCDVGDGQVFPNENPGTDHTTRYSLLAGGNDATYKGTGTYEPVFQTCHKAILTWLTIPSAYKVFGQNAACVQAGTWVNDNTYQTGIGVKSTTNGSTLTCTLTTYGAPIYVWYRVNDAYAGTFTYAVDGGSTTSVNSFTTPALATHNGGTQAVALIRIPGIAAGSHTVTFAVTSATNASNVVAPLAVGTAPAYPYFGPATVYDGSVMNFETGDPNIAANTAYNMDANADMAQLQGDGLRVYKVNVNNYMNPNTASLWGDLHHPSDAGMVQLYDAFGGVMQYTPYSSWNGNLGLLAGIGNAQNSNATNVFDTSSLSPGLAVYDNGTNFVGMMLGYDASTTRYRNRIIAPNNDDVCLSSHVLGSQPTAQSAFTDNLCIRGDTKHIGIGTTAPNGWVTINDGASGASNTEEMTIKTTWATTAQKSIVWRDGTNIAAQIDARLSGSNVDLALGSLYSNAYSTGTALLLHSATASPVDYVQIAPGATGTPGTVTISAQGSDTNVNLALTPKGTGQVISNGPIQQIYDQGVGSGFLSQFALERAASTAGVEGGYHAQGSFADAGWLGGGPASTSALYLTSRGSAGALITDLFLSNTGTSTPLVGIGTTASVTETATIGGDFSHTKKEKDLSYTYNQPTTGQTVTLATGTETAIIDPAGTLATLTVTLPGCTSAYDGSLARFSSTQVVTTLTVNATSGSVADAPASLGVGGGNGYICRGSNTTWYRLN